jgi:hypothetical protein
MAARKWTQKELRLLGKRPNRELVPLFGRSLQAIVTKRSLLGIPRLIAKGEPRPWSKDEEALLGTAQDNIIAQNQTVAARALGWRSEASAVNRTHGPARR